MKQPVVKFDKFKREVLYSGSKLIVQSRCRLCGLTRTTDEPDLQRWEREHNCSPEERQRRALVMSADNPAGSA